MRRDREPSRLFDFIMFLLTGPFWLMWVIIRHMRKR